MAAWSRSSSVGHVLREQALGAAQLPFGVLESRLGRFQRRLACPEFLLHLARVEREQQIAGGDPAALQDRDADDPPRRLRTQLHGLQGAQGSDAADGLDHRLFGGGGHLHADRSFLSGGFLGRPAAGGQQRRVVRTVSERRNGAGTRKMVRCGTGIPP
ncbi:MAG: hypothetical protein U5R48_14500 [Gammaproteobacteria bacterium]|nr:hypothetical protein [Gammaproteobacteria bacterium]